MLLFDIVGRKSLERTGRLNALARYLGALVGAGVRA